MMAHFEGKTHFHTCSSLKVEYFTNWATPEMPHLVLLCASEKSLFSQLVLT